MSGFKGSGGGKRKPSADRVPWETDTSELLLPRRSPGGGGGTKTKSKGTGAQQAGRTANSLGDASNVRDKEAGSESSGWNLSRATVGGGGGGADDDSWDSDDEVDTLHPPSKNLHLLGAYNLANNGNRQEFFHVYVNRGWDLNMDLLYCLCFHKLICRSVLRRK